MSENTSGSNSADKITDEVNVFDRQVVRHHRDRAAAQYDTHDFLAREAAERLMDRLADINRQFTRILVLGHAPGLATALRLKYSPGLLIETDLSAAMLKRATDFRVAVSEEFIPFAEQGFDLVVGAMALHWVNDVPGALIQINRVLKPDGLYLSCSLGGQTLTELRQALAEGEITATGGLSPRVSPFADIRDYGGLLQRAGFAMPVVDGDTLTVTYSDAFALMRELRGMGETNAASIRRKYLTGRETLLAAAEAYNRMFARNDGRVPATFQFLFLTGWAPDASQPKPLRPGSAKARLADALKVSEVSLDEKTGR